MARIAAADGISEPSRLDSYQPLIGIRATDRLLKKARRLSGLKVLHVNSTTARPSFSQSPRMFTTRALSL